MPAFLLSPLFWKMAGAAILVLAITITVTVFVHHYHDLEAKAAMVPGLQAANKSLAKQAADNDSRAGGLTVQLKAAWAARDQALADFQVFQGLLGKFGLTLNGIAANANATKNPLCLPTDAERQLFNTATANFTGTNPRLGQPAIRSAVPAVPR